MLLRYVVLHGVPQTDEEWVKFMEWRRQQMALPECRMAEAEGMPDGTVCATCPGQDGCPKAARRRP